jgi:hypothetical protein
MLVYQLWQRPTDWDSLEFIFSENRTWVLMFFTVCLMPLNLGLEMKKWKVIHPHTLTWKQTIKAVLSGMSVGLLTPNKIGEYGGRVWFLPRDTRQAGVASTMMGNWAQLFTTILLGCLGFTIIGWSSMDFALPKPLMRISFLLIPIAAYTYFHSEKLIQVFEGFKWAKRLAGFFQTFRRLNAQTWWKAFFWSVLRYSVFSFQLALILLALSPEVTWSLFWLIPAYYFIQIFVPTIAVAELGVRGYLLHGLFFPMGMEAQAFLAGTFIWFINLVLPAVLGLYFILIRKPNGVA